MLNTVLVLACAAVVDPQAAMGIALTAGLALTIGD